MKPKNIVFILTDDMAPWSCGPDKHPNMITPNLDSLAESGTLLDKSFTASPICSPARSCLLTGLYGTETGIIDYLCSDIHDDVGIGKSTQTWARELQKNGYRTALFGKWHIGEADRFHPTECGYDDFKGWRRGAEISKDPEVEVDGKLTQAKGCSADIITNYAVDFIQDTNEQPFLVSLHFWEPHCNVDSLTEDGTAHGIR